MQENLTYIDTHCHLNMPHFSKDRDKVIKRAFSKGVKVIINIGYDEPSSFDAFMMAKENKGLYAVVGVHPHDSKSYPQGLTEEMINLLDSELVVAVGETGLDYHYDNSPRDIQKEVFIKHIDVAKRKKKPIVVHIREAYKDAIYILKSEKAYEVGGVIHCFSGDYEDAKRCIDMGFYISFAGPLTYPKANKLREIAVKLPVDRILCETDAPYLTPQVYRGKRNEPAYVVFVVEKLSELKGIPKEDLAQIVFKNAISCFGITN